ncbi:MAG: hypothetical protein AAF490_03305 [Chloroflexota bacterium]
MDKYTNLGYAIDGLNGRFRYSWGIAMQLPSFAENVPDWEAWAGANLKNGRFVPILYPFLGYQIGKFFFKISPYKS